MKRVLVEEIEKDMILARDVCGTNGNILLGCGTHLSPAMGRRLKNWGIDFVHIEGEEEATSEEDSASSSPDEIKAILDHKFSNVMNSPIMQRIHAAVYQFRVRKGA